MRTQRKPDPRCQIQVRVTPRSSQNKIAVACGGTLQIWVTAAPTDGQANAAVCELVAKALGLANSRVCIVRGEASRDKVLAIDGMAFEEVSSRLSR